MTTTEERLAALESAVGMSRAASTRLSPKDWQAKAPWPTVTCGDYNLFDWMRLNTTIVADQRAVIDAQATQIAALTAKVAAIGAGATGPAGPQGPKGDKGDTGPAGSGSGGSVDVKAALAAYDIHIVPGKLAIGMQPDLRYDAQIQVGAAGSAEILGRSNMQGLDGQNPGEVHTNVFSVAGNDGGIRWLQYLGWGPSGKIRNTTNRRASVLALDSMGDVCKSTQEIGEDQDGGQTWYVRSVGPVVEICTYKVGGIIRILKSVAGYGATDSQQL